MTFLEFATATPKERKDLLTRARKASAFLKAMSHEGRLIMLCILVEGEKSVSEIEEIMDMPQAAVSQQLARLRLDGLVQTRRDGRNIYYSLGSDEVKALITTLHDLFCGQQKNGAQRGTKRRKH